MVSPRSARLISSCRSWADFARQVSALRTTKERGDAFELLTQLYLTHHPEFRSKLESVWRLQEVPAAIRRQLRLPSVDEGIDLIAKTRQGEYWAIQAKYRSDRDKPLTTSNVAKFVSLAFATCKGIDKGVIAHSSSKPIRKQSLIGDSLEIGLERWLELTAEDWEGFAASLSGKTPKVTPRYPRPHQKAALASAAKHFKNDKATRGRLIMPCGTGKSLAAFFIADALKPRRVLVAVPSLALIKQSLTDWTREYLARGIVPDWLVVCSDTTTGQVDRDEFVSSAYEAGLPTTTKPAKIKEFLTSPGKAPKIVFTTYQSSPVLAAVARKARAAFDFAVLDEAHKTVGDKDRQFATLLFDKNLKIAQRLFMTATERVLVGRNDDVLTMDDEAVYGRRFYEMTFKDAIEQKIISDYKVLTVSVSQSRIDQLIAENRLVSEKGGKAEPVDARALAAGIALKRVYQRRGVKHAISFHRSIAAADNFREQQDRLNALSGLGPKAENLHISSKLSAGERAALLGEFKEFKRSLMTNARCLTEGVDVPAIDCVLFADPKQSKIDIVQAAGRALRLSPGKSYGYILLPLVVPDGMNFDDFAETTEFREIARTIAALSTQDQRIAEEFRAKEKAERSSGGVVEIEGDIPVGMKIDFSEFAKAIEARVWERVGKVNWRPFPEAREFVRGLGLKSQVDWRDFCRSGERPADVPANPQSFYKDQGWLGWGDWLGTGTIAKYLREYRPFKAARTFVRSLGLKSQGEWLAFCRSGQLPADLPSTPNETYAGEGWISWGDWLGTGIIANQLRKYRSFMAARTFARSKGLKSWAEWRDLCKSGVLPDDIPANPNLVYEGKGWIGTGDWLGTGTIAPHLRKYRPFKMARGFARSLNLKSENEWRAFCRSGRLPDDIPSNANLVYRGKGWVGWGDWLGTGSIAPQFREYLSFENARRFVQGLGLKSAAEWRAYSSSGQRPTDIPAAPARTYKGQGWVSWPDWLGTDRKRRS